MKKKLIDLYVDTKSKHAKLISLEEKFSLMKENSDKEKLIDKIFQITNINDEEKNELKSLYDNATIDLEKLFDVSKENIELTLKSMKDDAKKFDIDLEKEAENIEKSEKQEKIDNESIEDIVKKYDDILKDIDVMLNTLDSGLKKIDSLINEIEQKIDSDYENSKKEIKDIKKDNEKSVDFKVKKDVKNVDNTNDESIDFEML